MDLHSNSKECRAAWHHAKILGEDWYYLSEEIISLYIVWANCTVLLTFILLMWRIGRAPNSIPIYSYIQKDATSHNLFISGNCSTCFGWHFHPSSGAHTTVFTASGICHTVTAICRYRGSVGTGLSVLWVAYATHSTLKQLHIGLYIHKNGTKTPQFQITTLVLW
jgi:hypothetical protein